LNSEIFRREQRSRFEDGEKPVSYRLRSLVGRGGMAEVYRGDAIFEDGGRETVAIKRMRPDIKEPIDRTGAGDAFAGGFLAGLVQGKSLETAVDMGQWLARLSIQELGPS